MRPRCFPPSRPPAACRVADRPADFAVSSYLLRHCMSFSPYPVKGAVELILVSTDASAGPVGSTGFCDGECCSGNCNYDYATGKNFCCASPALDSKRAAGCWRRLLPLRIPTAKASCRRCHPTDLCTSP